MDIQNFETAYLNAGGKASELEKEDGEYVSSKAQIGWQMWQAATAQAVPNGFVLVNAESLALHAQSIRMFNNGDEENYYYEIENHVCAIEAMIEAQEQSHDSN
ncbi:hypothetical protein [Acinetobacter sp. TUM15064]|uniref:hypothetical protein n=1 Tax=Acinetobacter sp. TUM15064 TaxID=2609134 RepID=UPI00124C56F2|nr:hypothetical protein [Acinetobacter sp. TUM15064]